ncbi:MAG: hypothetical protein GX879_01600 [Bacteroidales bacterium]|nr:hypothetical protein [Bacteroidales bacterium]
MKFCVKHSIHFYQRKLGIFVLLLMPLFTFSQNNWAVKSSVGYGFLSPHHKSMQYLIESHSFNANLGLNIKMRNTNNWLQEWRMPTVNLSYYFASPGNKNAIGYAHSLLISSDISIITFGKSKLYYSIGGGSG